MLDLDKIINKSYQIKIKGELINVNQPSVRMVREFNASITNEENVDVFAVQVDFAYRLLNNNTSAKKFSKADIENMTTDALGAVIDLVANGVKEAENDPN